MDVITVKTLIYGVEVWLETDLRGTFGPGVLDVRSSDGSQRWINLRPFHHQIYKAMVRLEHVRLSIERVTIIQGQVAAHPPAPQHHRCPFCYGPIETLWGPVGRFSGQLAR